MRANPRHNRMPGLSICIPNWNHRCFLPRCLRSARLALAELRAQGVPGEVLVIDDCSRDGSQRALLALAASDPDNVIDVVLRPENRGLAAARNLATQTARYSHICFLDADNELCPANITLFWRSIEATGATVVFGNLIRHDGEGAVGLVSNCYVQDSLVDANYVDAFAFYDAARLAALGGFNEALRSHEDWEMYLHLLSEGEDLVFVPVCLGFYYVVPHSMVQTETFKHSRMQRMFGQRRAPKAPNRRSRRMYHPDIGWL